MQEQRKISECYDKTAENYAAKFSNELEHKHLDQILLRAFIQENKDNGKLIDLGCGPGQTTVFLYENGLQNLIGTDLSSEMISVATRSNPQLHFEQADMLKLKYQDDSFGSAIAFYAIVHFDYEQIKTAFREVQRVLMKNGHFLFSFHVGTGLIHFDHFLEHEVDIDFAFFEVERIKEILLDLDFEIKDIIERHPYSTEYPSKRAYFWAEKCR
ncbi:MAG: methyltransferase domain-containing protein [Bacteroidia bacterium]